MPENDYHTIVYDDLGRLDASAWDRLVDADPDANPFVRHAFLHAMQSSGAASPDTGWFAQFVTLWRNNQLAAAIPFYVKTHSYGEYVFDWSWADAQERSGLPYYPKGLVAVPFTPVPGTRLIAADRPARRAAIAALLALTATLDLTSLHVLFAPAEQIDDLASAGMLVRTNLQFHWRNLGYQGFEAFLAALTQPKRKKIRAERRKVREAGIELERRVGRDIREEDWRFFVRCYENTYATHGAPPYLNLRFFHDIARLMPQNLMLVRATRDGRPVASALALLDRQRSALYGRYWGALAHVPCLHFECCYYQMIDFAIEQGLQVFEGGAQGEHKLARGLDPVTTHSAHWLREPAMRAAVRRFVVRERESVTAVIDELSEHRAFRAQAALGDR
ncbi:conserved hypothetical protein [Burkholderiales bacterium]|nr:conserved hypothetical protein [Burkholderiales bacterium]